MSGRRWDPDGPTDPRGFARADHCDHIHWGMDVSHLHVSSRVREAWRGNPALHACLLAR
jgi:hypothetical protein